MTVYGIPDVTLPSPGVLAAADPALAIEVRDGGTAFRPALDEQMFVCRAIPSLYFRWGRDPVPQVAPPSPSSRHSERPVPPEVLASMLRLVFEVGNAATEMMPPASLSVDGRRQLDAACGASAGP